VRKNDNLENLHVSNFVAISDNFYAVKVLNRLPFLSQSKY